MLFIWAANFLKYIITRSVAVYLKSKAHVIAMTVNYQKHGGIGWQMKGGNCEDREAE